MRRIHSIAWIAAVAALTVVTQVPAASVDAVRTATVVGERTYERPQSAPPSGIRSYGRSPIRVDVKLEPTTADPVGDSAPEILAATSYRISGLPMAGSVVAFAVDPTGTRAVYVADQDTAGRYELYSTPLDGSATPTKLSAALAFGSGDQGVSAFEIGPSGTQVVFLADPALGGGNDDIYSVPLDGSSAAVRLNSGSQAPVTDFGLSPDGTRVAFLAPASNGATELFVSTVGTAASSHQVSDAGVTNTQGDVVSALFTPNGARLVYAADATSDNVFQWFSVAATASAPGSDVQLSAALGYVSLGAVSPDSSRLVYTSDGVVLGRFELYSVPIAGGTRVKLNPSMAGDGVRAIAISAAGDRVAYVADQDTDGVAEVYGALIATASSGARLSAPMSGTQSADALAIAPDGSVLYEADQDTAGTYELFRVPLAGGSAPTMLHDLTAPAQAGYFNGVGLPIVGRRALYPVLASPVELYSVPYDGSEPHLKVNAPLSTGDTVFNAFVPVHASRLVAYGTGASSGTRTVKILATAIRGDLPAEQFNVTAGSSATGVLGYEIDPRERYGVYLQDQTTAGKPELWVRPLDSDADGVDNVADNCPFAANASQEPVRFGPTVVAETGTRFGWGVRAEVRWVRGPLAQVAALTTDATGSLADAIAYTDAGVPAAGSGFFYLFAPDCAGRSWQTAAGAEPGRDLALP